MKKILFRVDSSSNIGLGHLMRCLELAKKFPSDNIFFASQLLEGNCNYKIEENGFIFFELKSNDSKDFIKLIKDNSFDLVIIDSYNIKKDFEMELKKNINIRLMVIDDIFNEHYCDYIYNPNIYANEKSYIGKVPSFCNVFAGKEYLLIREEFYSKQEKKRRQNSFVNILICFGGADSKNMTLNILQSLERLKKLDLNITIIIGGANRNKVEIEKYLLKSFLNCKLIINSNNMANEIFNNDLVITTASTLAVETLLLGKPSLLFESADNQRLLKKYLLENKLSISFGKSKDFDSEKFISSFNNVLNTNKLSVIGNEIDKFLSLFSQKEKVLFREKIFK